MEGRKSYKGYKIVMLVVLVAFVTFLLTSIGMYQYFTKGNGTQELLINTTKGNSTKLRDFNKYKAIIDKYYLGEIDEEKLKEGAIKGYFKGLGDQYTEYISKEDMKDYMEDTKGNFVGIGIYMVNNTKINKIQILAPIKNSPAEKAGILPGDIITAINDVEYNGEEITKASNIIKGENGTTVKLKVLREGKTLDFVINREMIKINPVEGKVIGNNIGYIAFASFDENTAEDFKLKFEELQKQGIKSLIIDLRNNGGGLVEAALDIADYIVEKDTVLLYEVDKNNNEKIKKAQKDPIIKMPIVVLTNENTASSSEILAGALKDLKKAKIVGTNTYGKGVIQSLLTLPDGSGVKITSEEYLTPNKTKINKVGIEPDVKVELPEELQNKLVIEESKDTQLQKAIEILK